MSYDYTQLRRDLDRSRSKRPILYIADGHWGEHAWYFLYSVILSHDSKDCADLRSFLSSLQHILPCKECRTHFSEYLSANEIPTNLADIFKWLEDLERKIAKDNGRTFTSRLEEIRKVSTVRIHQNRVQRLQEESRSTSSRQEKKVLPKRKKERSTMDRNREDLYSLFPCPNCSKPRSSLGVTKRSMGIA